MNIDYLRQYHKTLQQIDCSHYYRYKNNLGEWYEALSFPDSFNRKKATVALWKKYASKMSKVIDYLMTGLNDIYLCVQDNQLIIMYEITLESGEFSYFEGLLPISINDVMNHLPLCKESNDLTLFYTQLHNGFFYHANHSSGILPVQDCYRFIKQDWEVIDDLQLENVPGDNSFIVFESGGGGYIIIEKQSVLSRNLSIWIWYNDREPRLSDDLWTLMDTWMDIIISS